MRLGPWEKGAVKPSRGEAPVVACTPELAVVCGALADAGGTTRDDRGASFEIHARHCFFLSSGVESSITRRSMGSSPVGE